VTGKVEEVKEVHRMGRGAKESLVIVAALAREEEEVEMVHWTEALGLAVLEEHALTVVTQLLKEAPLK